MSGAAAGAQIGLAAISSGIQYAQGRKMKKKGTKLENSLTRPTYETPEYIEDNYKIAKNLASQGITDGEENAFKDNLYQSQTATINSFRDRKGGMLGAEVVGRQTNEALRGLRIEDNRKKLDNMKLLMSQGQVMADYQDKAFQLNELDPYADNMNYARSLQGAGMENMNAAINNFSQSVSSGISGFSQSQI